MALLVGYVIDRSLGRWDDSLFWRRLFGWPMRITIGLFAAAGIGIAIYHATLSLEWLYIVLPIYIVLREWIDHRHVLLISNRPAPAAPTQADNT
jgi:hypothetical protein